MGWVGKGRGDVPAPSTMPRPIAIEQVCLLGPVLVTQR
jgi:hypothetical protein